MMMLEETNGQHPMQQIELSIHPTGLSLFGEDRFDPCHVCGEPSSGWHCGAVTCEACKVRTLPLFFPLSIYCYPYPPKFLYIYIFSFYLNRNSSCEVLMAKILNINVFVIKIVILLVILVHNVNFVVFKNV
jgi:hypothetical protein